MAKRDEIKCIIDRKLSEINDVIIGVSAGKSNSLLSGVGSSILFLHEYYKYTNSKEHYLNFCNIVSLLFSNIGKNSLATFCNGHAGISWLVRYLFENKSICKKRSISVQ